MIFKMIIIWFSNRFSYDFQIDYHMIFKMIIIWFSNRLSYDFRIDYHMIFKSNIIWLLNRFSYDNLREEGYSFLWKRLFFSLKKGESAAAPQWITGFALWITLAGLAVDYDAAHLWISGRVGGGRRCRVTPHPAARRIGMRLHRPSTSPRRPIPDPPCWQCYA